MAGRTSRGWAYADALAYLDGLVNLEAVLAGDVGSPTLHRIRQLTALMGDPERAYPVVHLTGTNGKGSTARMITALLAAMGLSVGTYTSPDLERVNERLAWNSGPIGDEDLAALIEAVAAFEPLLDEPPSRFEILTAAAYRWFADVAVDTAVVEVGLGGRWDATNVADATISVVTNVSADHAEILGPTLADIAAEKAGIVKPGSLLVLGETDPELARIFREAGPAEVWERDAEFAVEANRVAHGGRMVDIRTPSSSYRELYLPVHGAHQADNAAVALAAAEAFFGRQLPTDAVESAFAGLRLPGRMEVLSRQPLVLLDGAHNPAGARAAAATLAEEFDASTSRILVLGMLAPRDPAEMLEALGVAAGSPPPPVLPAAGVAVGSPPPPATPGAGVPRTGLGAIPDQPPSPLIPAAGRPGTGVGATTDQPSPLVAPAPDAARTRLVIAVAPPSPRAVPPGEVARAAASLGVRAEVAGSVAEALALARAEAADTEMVLVTGSLYLVGAARAALRAEEDTR